MTFPAGTRLGPYEIEAPIGAGGMGEVYRARDTRLHRAVAIKFLSRALASDPEFRARFDREARTISALEHPHVCALHDVGEHEGHAYLVMQYLDGESLAGRLARAGRLDPAPALAIAIEVADALDAAHRRGIVHRDLKPGNVMLTRSGAKLLDFGLAKSTGAVAVSSSRLDTQPHPQPQPLTSQGALVGTLQYMAPEQVEGREADVRSDVWALGCVLYEMLTGEPPFKGGSPASAIGSILRDVPPPPSRAGAVSPPALDRLVVKCLEKDPDRRWQTAIDLRDELRWLAEGGGAQEVGPRPRRVSWTSAAWAAGLALLAAVIAAAIWLPSQTAEPDARLIRLAVALPPGLAFDGSPVLSPDGTRLVFVATSQGRSSLWVRSLDTLTVRQLTGTEDGSLPFWSPDGRSIGFFADGRLKRTDVEGSAPQSLADAPNARGGTWNRDGTIVFAPLPTSGLSMVSASGGPVRDVTQLDREQQDNSHRFPAFFPDGRRFAFRIRSAARERTGVFMASLDDGTPRQLLWAESSVAITPRHVLFARESTLFAQPFDPESLAMAGDPVAIAADVGYDVTTNRGAFSASDNGSVAYYPGGKDNNQNGSYRMIWLDRTGRELGAVGATGLPLNPALSPNGKYLAFDRVIPETGARNLWLAELDRKLVSRFSFSTAADVAPIWMPDNDTILFTSSREGANQLYRKSRTAGALEQKIADVPGGVGLLGSVSADGRVLVMHRPSPDTRTDIWVMELDGTWRARPLIASPFEERQPRLSPDGRWLAFISDESGTNEVYIQSFPGLRERVRVSTAGGAQPQWRSDGTELYYVAPDQKLMAVKITSAGAVLGAGTPTALFPVRSYSPTQNRNYYVADASGERFLVTVSMADETNAPIIVMHDWRAALKR